MADPNYQIAAQLEFIQSELAEYFETIRGTILIASNVQSLWIESAQNTQSPMGYVCYVGESPWSSNSNIAAVTHRVTRDWVVRVKQGRGLTSVRGASVAPFSEIVERVRDLIRSFQGLSEDLAIDYTGTKPVRLGDQIIDCYDISFSTKNDLPPITMTGN